MNKFHTLLKAIDWNTVLNVVSCQEAFSKFHHYYCECFNESFPLVPLKSNYHNRKSWLTESLKNSIKVKNKLYVISIKRPYIHNKNKYETYKKLCRKL